VKFSPALAKRLQGAEEELAGLRAALARRAPEMNVQKLGAGLEARFVQLADDFERALIDRHGEKGRQEIRGLLGQFKVEADELEIRFYNEQSRHVAALLRAVGATDARNYGSGGLPPIQATPLPRQHSVEISTA
jgi:hypothetical protein